MKVIHHFFLISLLPLLSFFLLSCEDAPPAPESNPKLVIADLGVIEGNINNAISLQVDLSEASDKQVSVSYSTLDGTAKAGEDFEKIENETLNFAPGETQKEILVNIIADEYREENETFKVTLSNALNADITRPTAQITISNDDQEVDVNTLEIPTNGYTSPLSYSGMTMIWQDEFQDSTISEDWIFEIGDGCNNGNCGWGNNELEYYRKENASIAEHEYLAIQAFKEDFGGKNYTSTRMITKDSLSFQYGRIDVRAALPTGQGIWPAIWMLGTNIDQVGWPACGEIDIMEMIGNEPNTTHGTIHWDNAGQYASYGQPHISSTSLKDEFHVYSIIWDETEIRWLLDDVQFNVVDITPAGLSEFKEEFFLILNVAVGGNWPGPPNSTTVFPQRMLVDYIRVFQ